MQSKKPHTSKLLTIILLLCINLNTFSQCTWTQVEFDDFEGSSSPPFVVTGPIYGNGAHSAGAKNGSLGLWLNVQNGAVGFPNQVLYNRPYTVCPGEDYRFQTWIGGTGGSDFTTSVYDGTNITATPLATYNSLNGWNFQTIGAFTPTSTTITLIVRNNLQGNGGGNDFQMDDLELQVCAPSSSDSLINLCLTPGLTSLYDNLPTPMDNTGNWSGPSALTGGYLGNYDPATMSAGIYSYTISGGGVCPDSVNTVTINDSPDLTTTNITTCDPSVDISSSFIDNNFIGGTVSYWQDPLATIPEPNPTNITTDGTYYIVMDTAGCADTADVIVTINPLPPVDAGVDQSVCIGNQVTLTGTGATTLNWTNGITDGVPFTPTDTTTYVLVGVESGCVNTDTVIVFVVPNPIVSTNAPNPLCEGTSVNLSGSGATTYSWDNGVIDGNPFTPASTTTYTVIGTDANNCSDTAQVTVTVNVTPTTDIQPSLFTGALPLLVIFGNGSTTNINYLWDFGNGDTSSLFLPPNITYQNEGTYTVTLIVTDPLTGCSSSEEVTIIVTAIDTSEFSVVIPTIFTPNGDGINDVFNAVLVDSESYAMTIFNRWGNSLFQTNSINEGWDGKDASAGTYFYIISYSYKEKGELINKTVKGTVSLLK